MYLLDTNIWLERLLNQARAAEVNFYDAYQYVLAKRRHLTFVSFDTDFDRPDLPRHTPAQVLAALPPLPTGIQT